MHQPRCCKLSWFCNIFLPRKFLFWNTEEKIPYKERDRERCLEWTGLNIVSENYKFWWKKKSQKVFVNGNNSVRIVVGRCKWYLAQSINKCQPPSSSDCYCQCWMIKKAILFASHHLFEIPNCKYCRYNYACSISLWRWVRNNPTINCTLFKICCIYLSACRVNVL